MPVELSQTSESRARALDRIAAALLRLDDNDWTSAELRVTCAGGMMELDLALFKSDGSANRLLALDEDGEVACEGLRLAMYEPGKGTWFNARFTVDANRQFQAEFDYDGPPFDGVADAELLIEDQRLFPRAEELLPAWHPSRRSA